MLLAVVRDLFPLGIMNVAAMVALTLLIFAEKTLPAWPHHRRAGRMDSEHPNGEAYRDHDDDGLYEFHRFDSDRRSNTRKEASLLGEERREIQHGGDDCDNWRGS